MLRRVGGEERGEMKRWEMKGGQGKGKGGRGGGEMGGRAREGKGEGEEEAMVVRERVEEETSESKMSTTIVAKGQCLTRLCEGVEAWHSSLCIHFGGAHPPLCKHTLPRPPPRGYQSS